MQGENYTMKKLLKTAAFAAAVLGLSAPALAQTTGGGLGGTGSTGSTAASPAGTAGGTGPGATGSTSPGVSGQNDTLTGVDTPGTAPVDDRSHEAAQAGTGATGDARTEDLYGTGSAEPPPQKSMEGALANKAPSRKVRDGLAALHAANRAEIMSGEMAQQSASSPDVKAFAERMVSDHTQADQQLVSMARPRVDLMGKAYEKKQKDATDAMKDLQGKTGSAFDQAYMAAMLKDHEKDAAEVQKTADQARKDGRADWADFLDQVHQTMLSHLSEARRVQSAVQSASVPPADTTSGTGSSTDTGSSSSSSGTSPEDQPDSTHGESAGY